MNKIRILLSFILCIAIVCISTKVTASEAIDSKIELNDEAIARRYVLEDFDAIIDSLMENEIFKSRITDKSFLGLGEPYIVYHVDTETQEKIYYYPIVDEYNRNVVYLIEAICVDGVYVCNTLDNMVEVLNEMDYVDVQCIVYFIGKNIYVESSSKIINTNEFYAKENSKAYVVNKTEEFIQEPFFDKQAKIHRRMNELVECEKYDWNNDMEKAEAKSYGSLTLINPQGQYSYGMCWASAVATVHNYLCSSVITGFEVCTRMAIGYNSGGDIYDQQDALALYNISYNKLRNTMLTWEQLVDNINNEYPIIANGFTTTGLGHSVVIYGYTGSSSTTNNVKIWNSYLNSGKGGYASFTKNKGYFTNGDGYNYFWETSLSYY